jgi:hypothetical protein
VWDSNEYEYIQGSVNCESLYAGKICHVELYLPFVERESSNYPMVQKRFCRWHRFIIFILVLQVLADFPTPASYLTSCLHDRVAFWIAAQITITFVNRISSPIQKLVHTTRGRRLEPRYWRWQVNTIQFLSTSGNTSNNPLSISSTSRFMPSPPSPFNVTL